MNKSKDKMEATWDYHRDPCVDCGSRVCDDWGNCIPCAIERRDIKVRREDDFKGQTDDE